MNKPDTPFSLKDIEANPERCCLQHWTDADRARDGLARVTALLDELNRLNADAKARKEEKQLCARQFGQAKSQGLDLSDLKAQMQQVSSGLNAVEDARKRAEDALLTLFATPEVPTAASAPALPERFSPPQTRWEGAVSVSLASEADGPAWDAYVESHPRASLYHLYRWRAVVRDSFGHNTPYLIARDGSNQIRGVLPLVQLDSRLFGNFAVSMPFFNYGGTLADSVAVAEQLLAQAVAVAEFAGMKHMEIRDTHPQSRWPARTDKVSMIRRLPTSITALETELGSKLRAQIKRAHQENISIVRGHLNLLDDFYAVFAENMRDLGTPVYGKSFFANILRTFPQQAHLICVYLDGKPVSCAFLLGYREMMEIPWASTLRSVNAGSINMALYRDVLGFCIEQQYHFFDFGRSTKDAGTYKFKKQWGAQPVQHYWHYWLKAGGPLPELKPSSPKFRLMIATWQRLPVFISKLIGPHVVKYLP